MEHPECHVEFKHYYGDMDDAEKNKVSDIDSEFAKYQCVIYTPVITVGISFDIKNHFNCVYAWLGNATVTARTAMQAIHRIRNVVDNQVFVAFDKQLGSKPDYLVEREEIEHSMLKRKALLQATYQDMGKHAAALPWTRQEFDQHRPPKHATPEEKLAFLAKIEAMVDNHHTFMEHTVPSHIFENEVFNKWEENTSRLYFEEMLLACMQNDGYTVCVEDVEINGKITESKGSTLHRSEQEAQEKYANIQNISRPTFEAMQRLHEKTEGKNGSARSMHLSTSPSNQSRRFRGISCHPMMSQCCTT